MRPKPAHIPAWKSFKRLEDGACAAAALVYAAGAIHAWRALPGGWALKAELTLLFPLLFLLLCLLTPLFVVPLGRRLKSYVWLSYKSGFGQTAPSVIAGLGLLGVAAAFIFLQINGATHGGRYPAGVFSGYGAGIGILLCQSVLVRALEYDREVRPQIEIRP